MADRVHLPCRASPRPRADRRPQVGTITSEIDPATHRWRGANGRAGEIPPSLRITFTGAREVQSRRGEGAIVFFEDGASTGGRVQLSARRAAWNIDVAWLTGEVKMRRAEAAR